MNVYVRRLISALLFCAVFSTSSFAADEVKENEGVLIIDVHARFSFQNISENHALGLWLTNAATGKSYGGSTDALGLMVVPEGVYCLDQVEMSPQGMGTMYFCKEPYIKVVRGKLNNAGRWSFVIDSSFRNVELKESLAAPDQTLELVKKKYPDYF